jgi:hypothetical protein
MKQANMLVKVGSVAGLLYFFFAEKAKSETQLLVACAILGFFMLMIFVPAYEIAVEQTHHKGIGESVACGVINSLGNVLSAAVAIGLTPLLGQDVPEYSDLSLIIIIVLELIGFICLAIGGCLERKAAG